MITAKDIRNACKGCKVKVFSYEDIYLSPEPIVGFYLVYKGKKDDFTFDIRLHKSSVKSLCNTAYIEHEYNTFYAWLSETCKRIDEKLEDKNETKD